MTNDPVLMKALKTAQDQGSVGWAKFYALAEAIIDGDKDEAERIIVEQDGKFDPRKSRIYELGYRAGYSDGRGICQHDGCEATGAKEYWTPGGYRRLCPAHEAEERAQRQREYQEQQAEKARREAAARTVDCPLCSAAPGAPCTTPRGQETKFHAGRLYTFLGIGMDTDLSLSRLRIDWNAEETP